MKSIAAYTVAVVGVKGAGRDDFVKQVEIVRSCRMEEPLV